MPTSIERAPLDLRRDAPARTTRISARQALPACGIVYALLYVIVNDVIAATLYDGYSRMSQAVSELSATGAPTHALLTAVGPVFSLLLIGFGPGIWRSARGKRSLRIAGALVAAHGAMSFLWLLGPMSQREVIAAGRATSADDLHLFLSAATGLFMTVYVATTAVGLGWVFRLYSVATIATALVFGLLSAQVDKLEAGAPTPWMGLLERIGIGGVVCVAGRGCDGPVASKPEPEGDGLRHTRGACRPSGRTGRAWIQWRHAMSTIRGQIQITRPVEEVFDFVADETNEPRYNQDMLRCDKLPPGPIGVGTSYEAKLKSTGAVPMTVEVTGFERPRRLQSRAHIKGTMDIRGAVTFEAIPEGTLMSWEWDVEPHGCMRLLGPFVTRMGRRNEERIWAGLKNLLETRHDAAPAV